MTLLVLALLLFPTSTTILSPEPARCPSPGLTNQPSASSAIAATANAPGATSSAVGMRGDPGFTSHPFICHIDFSSAAPSPITTSAFDCGSSARKLSLASPPKPTVAESTAAKPHADATAVEPIGAYFAEPIAQPAVGFAVKSFKPFADSIAALSVEPAVGHIAAATIEPVAEAAAVVATDVQSVLSQWSPTSNQPAACDSAVAATCVLTLILAVALLDEREATQVSSSQPRVLRDTSRNAFFPARAHLRAHYLMRPLTNRWNRASPIASP